MDKQSKHIYEFGPFRLDTSERVLLRDGVPVPLSPKALETLIVLVQNSGHIVEKDELMKSVWPDAFVEEGGLTRNVSVLRKVLGEDSAASQYIETVPKRGYRFAVAVREMWNDNGDVVMQRHGRLRVTTEEEIGGLEGSVPGIDPQAIPAAHSTGIKSGWSRSSAITASLLLILAVGAAVYLWLFHVNRAAPLTERDTILLAEFDNRTGDEVFDGTLKQALAVQLEQSPFLSILSEERVRETLRYMGRPAEEVMTKEVAREVCQRQGIKGLLTGSIVSLGSHYAMTLEAIDTQTGDVIARAQVEAAGKEQVLRVLGGAALTLRERLGESLPSIQKFDAPVEQVTTSSLEALKAFSLAREQHARGKYLEAIPLYQRAIELDPNFALAYNRLSAAYSNTRQPAVSVECSQRAFELRERVSEREKLYIAASYYSSVTRELDKTIEAYELLRQTYPRDFTPRNNLALALSTSGLYEKALEEAREAIRLNPTSASAYSILASAFMGLNRFDEAKEVLDQAVAKKTDGSAAHAFLHSIALIKGDSAGMQRQVDWAKGRSDEYLAVEWEAQVADLTGQRRKARELYGRAIEMAKVHGLKESAATMTINNALRYALLGDCGKVKAEVASAFAIMRSSRLTLYTAAEALTLCGETAEAQPLVEELERQYPKDTDLNQVRLPTMRAIAEINRGNPTQAIQLLQTTSRYELAPGFHYRPIYARGLAYLRTGDGAKAMVEFQKILDNRGVDALSIRHPLAHLGLARGAALAGDPARGRKAYEDFFALWKDADPDIPILQEAKREYAKLK